MLVTGYFLVTSRGVKGKKLILLLAEVLFYYLVTYAIATVINGAAFGLEPSSLLMLFPTILGRYWYATAYIVLYVMSPWINHFVLSLERGQLLRCICVLLILYSVIPTVFGVFGNGTESFLFYTRLLWLFVIYLCGAFLRLHSLKMISTLKRSVCWAIGSFLFMVISLVVVAVNEEFFSWIGLTEWAYFWPPNTVPMFLASLGVFAIFQNIALPQSKAINRLASTTFGIYLIHDGPMQGIIWRKIVNAASHQSSTLLPVFVLAAVLAVFLCCALIDMVRQLLQKWTLERILASEKWERWASASLSRVDGFIENRL